MFDLLARWRGGEDAFVVERGHEPRDAKLLCELRMTLGRTRRMQINHDLAGFVGKAVVVADQFLHLFLEPARCLFSLWALPAWETPGP